jgi:thiamine biosynthesis lipoprotein
MIRCKALLGTFVEVSTPDRAQSFNAIENAFLAITEIQDLMGFHQPNSELSKINSRCHLEPIQIHPWTAKVLTIAQEIHLHSGGLFNCGIGHHLVARGLLPKHVHFESPRKLDQFGGIEHLQFLNPTLVRSDLPLCLDLGGVAKGFAVDLAINILQSAGAPSGSVNAGGDLRVFGSEAQMIHIRNPANPCKLIHLGNINEAAIATSGLYFSKRNNNSISAIVNPLNLEHIEFSESYSVIADQCVYADALTKVVSISGNTNHPCLRHFSAQAIKISNSLNI